MNCQPEGFHKTSLKQREASDRSMGSQHRRQISPRPCGLKGLTTSKTGFAQRTAVIQIQSPCLGMGCVTTLTPARTPRLRLSQHNDTCKNIKDWAVSQHTATSKNTKAWAVSQHKDASKNTKAWAVSQHIDASKNIKDWAVSQHTDTSNTKARAVCHNTLTPATTPGYIKMLLCTA